MDNETLAEGDMSQERRPFDVAEAKARHEARGRKVREVWIEWANEQPNPKPSWLMPYDELSEADQDVDKRIGAALYRDGFLDGVNFGLKMAADLAAKRDGDPRASASHFSKMDDPYSRRDTAILGGDPSL